MGPSITLDELVVIINAQTKNFKQEVAAINEQLEQMGRQSQGSTTKMQAGFDKVGSVATKALKWGVVGAIGAVAASIPGAVKRIDTLVAFPRVLEAMGASSEQAAKATKTLSDRLTGLPTPLQDGAAGVQALVAAGLGVEDATDVFLAFNNATLAAGVEAGAAKGAFMQLTQSISKGKIDGQEWNSIISAMPTAFQALSKESGLTREELRELYRTNPQQLLDDLVKLDKVGGGGLASLEEQARAATGGIGTSFENMKNAITRGLQAIVTQLGNGDLEAGQRRISDAITALGQAFGQALVVVGGFVAFVMAHSDIFGPLAAGIATAVAAILAYNTYVKVSAVVTAAWSAASTYMTLVASLQAQGLGLLRAAWLALNIVMRANPIGLVVTAIMGIIAAIAYFVTQTETGRKIFAAAMEAIKTAATVAWNVVKAVWSAVSGFFTGQFNAVKVVATAVVGAISALFSTAYSTVRGVWSAVSGFFSGQFNAVRNVTSSVVSAITSFFSSAWSNVRGIWSAASGFFAGVVGSIRGAISGIPGAFGSTFQSAWNKVTSIFGKIGSWFSSKAGEMASAGRDMVAGLVNGLNPGPVIEKMKSIASSAIDTVKSFLGIKSPSRVMRDQVGKMMGAGMAQGIDQSTSDAVKAASNSARRVLGAYDGSFTTKLPTPTELSSKLDISASHKLTGIDNRQIPVNVQLDGDTLLSFVIDGVNGKSFMTNQSPINF